MSKLPEFLHGQNKLEMKGVGVIIQTRRPYIVGKIWRYKDGIECMSFLNEYKGLGKAVVPGYNIVITFLSTVTEHKLENIGPSISADIKIILERMADFYMKEVIEDKPQFYKKYKL